MSHGQRHDLALVCKGKRKLLLLSSQKLLTANSEVSGFQWHAGHRLGHAIIKGQNGKLAGPKPVVCFVILIHLRYSRYAVSERREST